MKDFINLIMGLISGFVLILLNTSIVKDTIGDISMILNPELNNSIVLNVETVIVRVIPFISFIGILIVLYFNILILKKVLSNKK